MFLFSVPHRFEIDDTAESYGARTEGGAWTGMFGKLINKVHSSHGFTKNASNFLRIVSCWNTP